MEISSSVDSCFSSNNIVESGRTSESSTLCRTDMLDFGVCFEPLTIPIYQCVKGHISCSRCRSNLQNNCPTCCLHVDVRNYGLEEVLEAVKITCLNSMYGCNEKLRYRRKRMHMRSCIYEPCHCPLPGCGFHGSYKDLYLHFARKHLVSATRFTFDSSFSFHMGANMKYKFLEEDDHTLFILNYDVHTSGYIPSIICIGPSCLQNKYSYELEAGSVDISLKINLLARSLPKWTVDLPKVSPFVVPKGLIDSSRDHKIKVCISRKGEICPESSSASS